LRSRLARRGMAPAMTAFLNFVPRAEPLAPSVTMQTAKAAIGFASRTAAIAGAIRPQVAPLALEMLNPMAATKVTSMLAAISVFSLIAAGSAALALQPPADRPKSPTPPATTEKTSFQKDDVKSILSNGEFERGDPDGPSPEGWKTGAELAGVAY